MPVRQGCQACGNQNITRKGKTILISDPMKIVNVKLWNYRNYRNYRNFRTLPSVVGHLPFLSHRLACHAVASAEAGRATSGHAGTRRKPCSRTPPQSPLMNLTFMTRYLPPLCKKVMR